MPVEVTGFRCDNGLFLPGIHPDAVRAAHGVFRLLRSDDEVPADEAMAHAIWTFLSWMERYEPSDALAAWNRAAMAKQERFLQRRLLATGKGTPEEVQLQLSGAIK